MARIISWFVIALFVVGTVFLVKYLTSEKITDISVQFPLHQGVTVSFFWVGEEADSDNQFITNVESAWDQNWQENFGGVDDPDKRRGHLPQNFTPLENPFYFALPYNDFNEQGARKPDAYDTVYWATEKKWGEHESMCKNRWIKIIHNDKAAYAQWEDVGPFETDDASYVFGKSKPKSNINNNAGLDVSPAVRDYLGLDDLDIVDWQFVTEKDIPDGPWKEIITTSNQNLAY